MVDSTILPPELWVEMFSWIQSLADLSTLALVCHNWRTEAERFLYQSIDIYRLDGLLIDPLLSHIANRTRPIASHIHKFVAFTNAENLNLVHNVLFVVHNLGCLTLLKGGESDFNPSLPSTNVPFALEIFKTDYGVDQGLHEFLRSQRTIRLLSWAPIRPFSPIHALSPGDVPNIQAIHVRNDDTLAHHQLVIPSVRSIDIRIYHFEMNYNYAHIHITAVRVAYGLGHSTARILASIFPCITYLSAQIERTLFEIHSVAIPSLVHFPRLFKVQFVVSGTPCVPMTLSIDGPASLQMVEIVIEPKHYSLDHGGGEVSVDRFHKGEMGQYVKTGCYRGYRDTCRLEWATWDG